MEKSYKELYNESRIEMQQNKKKLWVAFGIVSALFFVIAIVVNTFGGRSFFIFPLWTISFSIVIAAHQSFIPKFYNEYRKETIEDLIRNYDISVIDPDINPFTDKEILSLFPELKKGSVIVNEFNGIKVEGVPIYIANARIYDDTKEMLVTHFNGTFLKMETTQYESFHFVGEKPNNVDDYDLSADFDLETQSYSTSEIEHTYPKLIKDIQEYFTQDVIIHKTTDALYVATPKIIPIYHDLTPAPGSRNKWLDTHSDLDEVFDSWRSFKTIKQLFTQSKK